MNEDEYQGRKVSIGPGLNKVEGSRSIVRWDYITPDNKRRPFRKWASNTAYSKVYVVMSGDKFLYVGETGTKISERLKKGLKLKSKRKVDGTERKKTYRYAWRELNEVEVHVFKIIEREQSSQRPNPLGQAVEAELTYLIRKHTDQWPTHQTEIHFSNAKPKKARKKAKEIFEFLLSK